MTNRRSAAKGRGLRLVKARPADAAIILRLINELAKFEKLSHEVVATPALIRKTLFGRRRHAEVWLAKVGLEAVGFALFFHNYSTFLGRPGIYLEDLFVKPAFRERGIGEKLLRHVARQAVRRGCGRLEWSVLDWNKGAIKFYRRLGARPMSAWTAYRVTGARLRDLAR